MEYNVNLMLEMTRMDLLNGASPEPWKDDIKTRAAGYSLKFEGVDLSYKDRRCVCKFATSKAGHTDQTVYISLDEFWDMWDENEESDSKLSLASLLNLVIMHGKLRIYCSCPAWLYSGNKYMATQLDYAYYQDEHRFPKIRNPHLKGTVCKHAWLALKALPYQKFGIEAAIKRQLKGLPQPEGKEVDVGTWPIISEEGDVDTNGQ